MSDKLKNRGKQLHFFVFMIIFEFYKDLRLVKNLEINYIYFNKTNNLLYLFY